MNLHICLCHSLDMNPLLNMYIAMTFVNLAVLIDFLISQRSYRAIETLGIFSASHTALWELFSKTPVRLSIPYLSIKQLH